MISSLRTPILVMAFNRPDTLEQQLSRIDLLEKRSVYLSIDGLPEMYTGDRREAWQSCVSVARSWSGKTHHNPILRIQSSNLGLYDHFQSAFTEFFDRFPVGIVLEDDLVFVQEFIDFVDVHQNLLLDGHYWSIEGNNPLPGHDLVSAPRVVEITFRETYIHTISGWASSAKNVGLFLDICDVGMTWQEVTPIISNFSAAVTRDPALRLGIQATWLRKVKRARLKALEGSWDNNWELAGWHSGLPSLMPSFSLSRESSDQEEGQSHPHSIQGKPWNNLSIPSSIHINEQIKPISRMKDVQLLNIWGIKRAYCWMFFLRLLRERTKLLGSND